MTTKELNRRLMLEKDRQMSSRARLPLVKRTLKATTGKIKSAAISYTKSKWWMMWLAVATLASCIFYAVGTYIDYEVVIVVEVVFAVIFLLDWLLSLMAARVAMAYLFSLEGLVDLCSILPVFGAFKRWIYSLSFIRYLRLIKAIRIMRIHRSLGPISTDDATFKAVLLGLKVVGLILMTTAIIYGTEQAVDEGDREDGAFNEGNMKWHDALYFTVVTLSTVGYGDVLPVQAFSRMLMVVIILFALTYVPLEVGHLVDSISQRPKYRKGFNKALIGWHLHVVVAMVGADADADDGFDADLLRRVLEELFHEDHGTVNESLWAVVMAPCLPSTEVQALLRSPKFVSRVIYYRGTVMDPNDMGAVCAEYADCIFLYPTEETLGDSKQSEERTTLAAKALQRYLDRTPTDPVVMEKVTRLSVMGRPCRTVVTVRELASKDQLLRFGIEHVICHDELKMAMLACGTLCPAFLPFVINALRSTSTTDMENSAPSASLGQDDSGDGGLELAAPGGPSEEGEAVSRRDGGYWLDDYSQGMQYEVYSLPFHVPFGSSIRGMTFKRAALHLYELSKGQVLLMAVVSEHSKEDSHVSSRHNSSIRDNGRRGVGGVTSAGSATGSEGLEAPVANPSDVNLHSRPASSSRDRRQRRGSHFGSILETLDVTGRRRQRSESAVRDSSTGATSYIHPVIFPRDTFTFTEESYVLVLATDKKKAEDSIYDLTAMAKTETAPPADEQSLNSSSTEAAFTTRVVGADQSDPVDAAEAGEAGDRATALVARGARRALPRITAGPGHPGEEPLVSPVSDGSNVSFSEYSKSGRMRRRASVSMLPQTQEEKAQLESFRNEIRQEEGVRWKDALQALQEASTLLKELEGTGPTSNITEAVVSQDPAGFFGKVEAASNHICNALRVHTAHLPEDLKGHLVVVGNHPRLQHYILALRRQRQDIPVVVVTHNEAMFFELRERLVQFKCRETSLDISKIYHVFGQTKDTWTFEEAKIDRAEAIVLLSDQPDDSEVLLVSFELEQLLGEMELGETTPKVVIDLHKDSSIYYCGHNLSRGGPGVSSSAGDDDNGRLQDILDVASSDVWEWPLFAAGRVWTESIMDVVAVQTYFGMEILAFFETLLEIQRPVLLGNELVDVSTAVITAMGQKRLTPAGGISGELPVSGDAASRPEGDDAPESSMTPAPFGQDMDNPLQRGQFDQLKVSHHFKGKRYGDLVRNLILRGAMPIGLYRPAGLKGSKLPYTHVNPDPSEPLLAWPKPREGGRRKARPGELDQGDSVFVLRSGACRVFDTA